MEINWFLEFVAKYWLTFLFGLIAAGLGIVVKHYKALIKKEKEVQKQEEFNNIIKDVKEYTDTSFKETQESHNRLYNAVLDVQSKQFQRDCYECIKSKREITLEEFDSLYRNYEIYKSLGGNGIGTMLFDKVEEKYNNQLLGEQLIDVMMDKMYDRFKQDGYILVAQPRPTIYTQSLPTKTNQGEPKG